MTLSYEPRSIDERPTAGLASGAQFIADSALLMLIVALAFLLGCQELFDADFWWQVRSGQWILEHGRIPTHDPFTFASADREWVDLHWLFQVILAAVYRAGGVRGAIVMTATVCAATILIVVVLRNRQCPIWLVAACWLPAVAIMSARFVPRPEIFSVLFTALYLTILLRVDTKPALAWFLPLVQVLWVNTHGLFVLGPIASDPASAPNWTLLGIAYWSMIPDLKAAPPGPGEAWDTSRVIFPAQASFCFRRALELDPTDERALSGLRSSFESRGMSDAANALIDQRTRLSDQSSALAQGQPIVSDWATTDRAAMTLLHLGHPAEARQIWERVAEPPSPAVRQSRIATAALVSQDFRAAREGYESALKLDPKLGEAWFALALLHAQLGEAAESLAACERGLRERLTVGESALVKVLKSLITTQRSGDPSLGAISIRSLGQAIGQRL
jgi:tetratricopeptide (TPR) repeat protein